MERGKLQSQEREHGLFPRGIPPFGSVLSKLVLHVFSELVQLLCVSRKLLEQVLKKHRFRHGTLASFPVTGNPSQPKRHSR